MNNATSKSDTIRLRHVSNYHAVEIDVIKSLKRTHKLLDAQGSLRNIRKQIHSVQNYFTAFICLQT